MKLVYYPDKILRKKCQEVKEFDSSLESIVLEMIKIMQENRGAGLAAPQIGINKRIITVDTGREPLILINSKILKSQGKEIMEEGCLSFPGLFLKIKRAKKIKVEGKNLRGEKLEFETEGLAARIIQHEVDHLNGILFIDRIGFLKKWRIERKYKEKQSIK